MSSRVRSLTEIVEERPDQSNRALVLSYVDTLTDSIARMSAHDPGNFAIALTELQWANESLSRLYQSQAGSGEPGQGIERRMTKRYGADKAISLRIDQTARPGQLLDISQTGVRLLGGKILRPGKLFRLKLTDEAEVSARVVWGQDDMIGATFVNHLAHMRQVSRFIISNGY